MKLSFIVPAYNEEKYLGECLQSISRACAETPWQTEIIVVDNASTDRTAEIAKSFPGVKVQYESHKGLTHARQCGLEHARGELLAYLDADTRLSSEWLKIAERVFADANAVCLSGPYRYYDLSGSQKFFAEFIWRMFAPLIYRLVGYMVLGGNFIARKSALERMGGFDTTIKFYGEDTNIAWRLAKIGRVVWRMDFFTMSSGRRLIKEGLIRSYWVYGVNYLWGALFHRPFSDTYHDIR